MKQSEQDTEDIFFPEIKDYDLTIDGKKFWDQSVKNDLRTKDNIQRITTGQGDDYTTGCLLDFV